MTDADGANRLDSWAAGSVPLVWYTYDEIRALMADGQALAPTHAEWEAYALKVEEFFATKGVATTRVPLDPREFDAWCRSRRKRRDARSRLAFSEWGVSASIQPGGHVVVEVV